MYLTEYYTQHIKLSEKIKYNYIFNLSTLKLNSFKNKLNNICPITKLEHQTFKFISL